MELRQVSRSPLLVFNPDRCLLRPVGIRRTRMTPPTQLSHCTPMPDNFRISQMHAINYMHRPAVEFRRKGDSSISCAKLCKVLWIIEADVADGQLLYITGDPVALGCWDPEMAIPLSPHKGHTNLWKAETKVPSGIHFKYNYFIKETNKHSHDIFWRQGPEFSLSIPLLRKLSENITVRDLWLKTSMTTPKDSFWSSWTSDTNSFFDFFELEGDETSCGGEQKMLQSDSNAALGEMTLSVDVLTTDDNFTVGKRKSIEGTESTKGFSERYQPVEEPWLFRSILPCTADCDTLHDVSDQTKVSKIETLEHECANYTEKLVHAAEQKLVRVEESVSTVILINSSVCTMQRIAILEDGKLVELLLEPVKNNVQCDSVYLGVVTKLVPHMGGAFVDIGISRPSLMDIKPNREPFAYLPFCSTTKGHEIYGSTGIPPKEDVEVDEHDIGSYVSDGIGNNLSKVHQDDFVHEDFEDHEVEDIIDVYDSHKKSISAETVDYAAAEIDLKADYEENEHYIDSEPVEEIFEKEHINKLEVKDSKDHEEKHAQQNKWTHVRKGTKVIVQVVKEGLGTKGPALTAYPNLRSRFWILISRCNRIGVSKKITGAERTRLRVIAKSLQPPGFGLTVRTVAAGHSLEELQKDLDGLLSTWKGIVEHAKSSALAADEGVEGAIPVILHRAMGQTLSVVQDYFNHKVKCMVADSPRTYHEVSNYLQEIAPDLCDRVVLYNKATPIFDEYGIEEEINNILSKRVLLSNGGSLVIEQTEALVSIDVNGGHSMLGQGTSQEKAVLDVNLAAAKRIARELRLRDIGGIIVVDFIDMADESNKRLVYEEIKKAVERDKSIVKVSELSRIGLMEITRKRVRPSVSFLISEPCICCHGTGRVEALETSFSKIEREISRFLVASNLKSDPENAKSWPRFVLKVDRYMCNYLTSGKRTKLAILSSTLKVWILLKVARGFVRGEFEVKPFTDDKTNDEALVTISRLPSAEARSYIPNTRLTLFPIKKWKTHGR